MDKYTIEKRSWIMSRIKGKDTTPEKTVRSMLHRMGFRFRLHKRDLPGSPDIAMPRHNTVIFVHGCFWHCHPGCKDSGIPKTNTIFWQNKLGKNVERDKKNIENLKYLGWNVVVIWECETKDAEGLYKKLKTELT